MTSGDPSPAADPAQPGPAPRHEKQADPPRRQELNGYLGALWILGPLMPGLAAVVTVGWYLLLPTKAGSDPSGKIDLATPIDPASAVLVGLVATALVWLISAVAARPLVSAPRAQPRFYAELLERSRSLRDRSSSYAAGSSEARAAADEARTQLASVGEDLEGEARGPALRWALASGYMSVMRALHRADEALIIVEPHDAAVGDALHDALSLEGSVIGNRERLIGILRVAVDRISPASATAFLAAGAESKDTGNGKPTDNEAREALREVRHAINEYRDDRHDGLVRARNRLVWTMLAVGITSYLLLALGMLAGIPTIYVRTVSVFYLVGAVVGLFDRLRIEAGQGSAVEDFGLSQARLVVTPLMSGLAAVAGVYLIAMTPALLPTGGADVQVPPFSDVFVLANNPVGLVYAAIFGLAPGTLTSRLRQASARLEQDLQSTEAAAPRSPGTDPGAN